VLFGLPLSAIILMIFPRLWRQWVAMEKGKKNGLRKRRAHGCQPPSDESLPRRQPGGNRGEGGGKGET